MERRLNADFLKTHLQKDLSLRLMLMGWDAEKMSSRGGQGAGKGFEIVLITILWGIVW